MISLCSSAFPNVHLAVTFGWAGFKISGANGERRGSPPTRLQISLEGGAPTRTLGGSEAWHRKLAKLAVQRARERACVRAREGEGLLCRLRNLAGEVTGRNAATAAIVRACREANEARARGRRGSGAGRA